MRNWSEVTHDAGVDLAWSSLDLFSLFVVECLHGEQNKKIKGIIGLLFYVLQVF